MHADIAIPDKLKAKFRKEWGNQNLVGLAAKSSLIPAGIRNERNKRQVRVKIARFVQRAIFPQQLTIPRQYATTEQGTWIYKILEGRVIDGFQEDGVRVIVQENEKNARFVISPLFRSKHDALSWAVKEMGATI